MSRARRVDPDPTGSIISILSGPGPGLTNFNQSGPGPKILNKSGPGPKILDPTGSNYKTAVEFL
jgi:hypothetical protein